LNNSLEQKNKINEKTFYFFYCTVSGNVVSSCSSSSLFSFNGRDELFGSFERREITS
jgi:hypothetical protein